MQPFPNHRGGREFKTKNSKFKTESSSVRLLPQMDEFSNANEPDWTSQFGPSSRNRPTPPIHPSEPAHEKPHPPKTPKTTQNSSIWMRKTIHLTDCAPCPPGDKLFRSGTMTADDATRRQNFPTLRRVSTSSRCIDLLNTRSAPDATVRTTIRRSLFVTSTADDKTNWWYNLRLPGGPSKGTREMPWCAWYSGRNAEPLLAAMRSSS